MFVCPAPISLPPQVPAVVSIWPSDPALPELEYCGFNYRGIPQKCECTEDEMKESLTHLTK